DWLELVAHHAKQIRGALGVVGRRMRGSRVPFETRCLHRPREDGLPVGDSGKGRRVEAGKRMEGIPADTGASNRGVQEAEVERGVVSHEDGARALLFAYRAAHLAANRAGSV